MHDIGLGLCIGVRGWGAGVGGRVRMVFPYISLPNFHYKNR